MPESRYPITAELYSPPISSRLSATPLCLYFSYFMHRGVNSRLSVYTLDNSNTSAELWTRRGHAMKTWRVDFVQIDSASGPFQVICELFSF